MKQNGNRILGKVLSIVFPMITCSAIFKIAQITRNSDFMYLGIGLIVVVLLKLVQVIKDDE